MHLCTNTKIVCTFGFRASDPACNMPAGCALFFSLVIREGVGSFVPHVWLSEFHIPFSFDAVVVCVVWVSSGMKLCRWLTLSNCIHSVVFIHLFGNGLGLVVVILHLFACLFVAQNIVRQAETETLKSPLVQSKGTANVGRRARKSQFITHARRLVIWAKSQPLVDKQHFLRQFTMFRWRINLFVVSVVISRPNKAQFNHRFPYSEMYDYRSKSSSSSTSGPVHSVNTKCLIHFVGFIPIPCNALYRQNSRLNSNRMYDDRSPFHHYAGNVRRSGACCLNKQSKWPTHTHTIRSMNARYNIVLFNLTKSMYVREFSSVDCRSPWHRTWTIMQTNGGHNS